MGPARAGKNRPLPFIFVALISLSVGLVTSGVLASASSPVAAPQSDEERPARVLTVGYTDVEGRGTVTVSLAGAGKASWKSFLLKDPARLVVDIEETILPSRPEPLMVGDGIVDRVRIAQFSSSVVRLVIDLAQESAYTVTRPEDNPHEIMITFPQRVTGMEFRETDGRAEAVVRGTGKLKYKTSILIDPPRIVVDIPGTVLVGSPGPLPVSGGIARQIRASQHSPDTVRVVVDLVKETTYSVFTSSDRPGEVVVDFGHRIVGATIATGLKWTRVSIESTGLPPVRIARLTEPHRLVMDFEDSVLDAPESTIEVGDGTIERIRLAQFAPMTVRAVVDLPYYVGHQAPARSVAGGGARGETVIEVMRSPLYGRTIVVDPGHGGNDPGAVGATGLHEKTVTLDISMRLAGILGEAGARAVLTRSADVSVFLPERVRIAADARADAFVSVHANAGTTGTSSGTETLYSSSVPMNRKLAEHVQSSLVKEIGLPDRGVRERPDLYVIREAKMPSCLVEVLFMSNLSEELLLMDPSFRDKAASGIAKGLWGYFEWRMEAGAGGGIGAPPAAAGSGESPPDPTGSASAATETDLVPPSTPGPAAHHEDQLGSGSHTTTGDGLKAPDDPAAHTERDY